MKYKGKTPGTEKKGMGCRKVLIKGEVEANGTQSKCLNSVQSNTRSQGNKKEKPWSARKDAAHIHKNKGELINSIIHNSSTCPYRNTLIALYITLRSYELKKNPLSN